MENQSLPAKIFNSVGRYVLGLIILVSPFAIIMLKGGSISLMYLAIMTPPINLVIIPPIMIGLYFMLSSKSSIRLDITLFLLYALSMYGAFQLIP